MTDPPPNYHIDRFDSLSTCNTDYLSLFDDLQRRRSNNLEHIEEMEPPPPSNSTFYSPHNNHLNQNPHPNQPQNPTNTAKQPLHLQISNTSTNSQVSDYGPSSAPITANGDLSPNAEFELLSQQSLFSGHRPLSNMRSVSFKKPKMAFPKTEGYVNPAYVDDEGGLLEGEQTFEEGENQNSGDQDSFLPLQHHASTKNPKNYYATQGNTFHTTDPDQMFTSYENPENLNSESEVHLRHPGKHSSQQYSLLEPEEPNYDEDKEWDRFETLPPPDDDETVDSKWVKISIQWLKIAAYIFTFACLLAFAVLSKSMTLLMTSMVAVNHSVAVCNSDKSFVIHEALQHDKIYKVQYGAEHLSRIAWLWCLYFAIVAPYVFAWLRAMRICYFKSAKVASMTTIATVSLTFDLGLFLSLIPLIPLGLHL